LILAGLVALAGAVVVATSWDHAKSALSVEDQRTRAEPSVSGQGNAAAGGGQEGNGPSAGQPAQPEFPEMSVPELVTIPAIGVRAPVIPLGWNSDGTLEVPSSSVETGWFRPGPEPGESGASIVVGHVSSSAGPAVFYHLRALQRGDVIRLDLKDGSTVRFEVRSSFATPKDRFPTATVYRHGGPPRLTLITCDGAFDQSTGHYVDNYVVNAGLISVDTAA
jgi:LPXTG-site transpeptidase (sortase) family protein